MVPSQRECRGWGREIETVILGWFYLLSLALQNKSCEGCLVIPVCR